MGTAYLIRLGGGSVAKASLNRAILSIQNSNVEIQNQGSPPSAGNQNFDFCILSFDFECVVLIRPEARRAYHGQDKSRRNAGGGPYR